METEDSLSCLKKKTDLSFFTNLADGILTVTLKGGILQKYTGEFGNDFLKSLIDLKLKQRQS